MTPTPDVKAAAERLRRWAENHANDFTATRAAMALIHDAGKVALHILAGAGDDGLPVTVQWIDAEIPQLDNDSGSPYQRRYPIAPCVRIVAEACPGGFNPCELWTGGGDGFRKHKLTRRDVRDLCRVLGVKLTEPSGDSE